MSNRERLYELMERYQRRVCTTQEEQELAFLCLLPSNQSVLEDLSERLWEEVEMGKEMPEGDDLLVRILHRPVVRKMIWWKVAVVLLLVVAGWFLVRGPKSGESGDGGPGTEVVRQDVKAPENNKARVTLSDGRTVSLDSLQNGLLADQSGVKLIKLSDGQIIYQSAESNSPSPLVEKGLGDEVNTLINPRGSRVINLTLSDGTRVWLNAGSSITYPVSFVPFVGNRKVEISGEAYFEIAHDKTKPFIVSTMLPSGGRGAEVEVLGTHFNVNAYNDEAEIKITLLEGSVKVSTQQSPNTKHQSILTPGQQAIVTLSGVEAHNDIDTEQVMAWKNGLFFLQSADIQTVMRQIARWYDVEVSYQGTINEKFIVKMDRNTNVSSVFKILEATGGVHFKIEGRKVLVMP